jgi:hypothetical protein
MRCCLCWFIQPWQCSQGRSCVSDDTGTSGVRTAADVTTSQVHSSGADVCSAAGPGSQGLSGGCVARVSEAHRGCTIPADSTLLLLSAAATALYAALPCLYSSKQEHDLLTQGYQHQKRSSSATTGSQDDIGTTLDAVLLLAHDLASGGPWWQEAKAKDPLLLVEMLYMTIQVRSEDFWVTVTHCPEGFCRMMRGALIVLITRKCGLLAGSVTDVRKFCKFRKAPPSSSGWLARVTLCAPVVTHCSRQQRCAAVVSCSTCSSCNTPARLHNQQHCSCNRHQQQSWQPHNRQL